MLRMIAALVLACLTGAPAWGQTDDAFPVRGSSVEAEQVLDSFARCVAENRAPFARQVLQQPLGSKEQGAMIRAHLPSGPNDCLGSRGLKLVFRPIPFAGGLASYFLTVRYPRYDLPELVRGAPAPILERPPERFGLCVVQHDTAGSVALVKTRLGGAEADAAVAAMGPALSACVTPGATVHLDKLGLRSAVAVVLYRYAAAAEDGAARN